MAKRLTKRQKRIEEAVAYLQKFMATYPNQTGYLDYTDRTFLNDMLYGIGVALGGKVGADGFDEFKDKLRAHLAKEAAPVRQKRSSTAARPAAVGVD